MREQIREELEKFTKIRKGANDELIALVLTDIIAVMSSTEEDGETKRNYEKFDMLVANIKGFIEGLNFTPDIPDLLSSIEESINSIKRVNTECDYSMRTLSWVDSVLEEEENNA